MFDLISVAHAQDAVTPQQNPIMSFVPFILVFFVFYFLMVRPQKKKLEQERDFLNQLKKGDEVYTKAGIVGTIVGMTDTVVDLEVSQGVKIKVVRSQIADLANKLFGNPDQKKA